MIPDPPASQPKEPTVTAWEIARRLMISRYRRSMVLPGFTPSGWWECDVFELTEAGYFREYEIKLSVADFRADKRKAYTVYSKWNPDLRERAPDRKVAKHDLLAEGSPKGPAKFWYVAPEGLLTPDVLPPWAGLIEVYRSRAGHLFEKESRKAPQLHRAKPTQQMRDYAVGMCYWRMHGLLLGRSAGVDDEPTQEWVI